MRTGIELIAMERNEQIKKHGWSLEHDQQHVNGNLVRVARELISGNGLERNYPAGWERFAEKAVKKEWKQKLIIAGALIAAEIDRLNSKTT